MKKELVHGGILPDSSGRWCQVCECAHGILYNCPHYPIHIQKFLERITKNWPQTVAKAEVTPKEAHGALYLAALRMQFEDEEAQNDSR